MARLAPDRRFAEVAGAAALAIAAIATVLYATTAGIGVSPDSTAYFANARWWLQRLGVANVGAPISSTTYFGPLYPLSLAAASLVVHQDPSIAARWIAVVVLPLNLLLAGAVVHRAAPDARYAPWMAALLFLTASELIAIHAMAWSEPVFIALVLLAVLALDAYLDRPRPLVSVGLAVTVAAACLQRFAGVALLLTTMVAIVCWGRGSRWQRAGSATVTAVVALLPALLWMRESPGFQRFAVHPVSLSWLMSAGPVVRRWFVPDDIAVNNIVRGAIAVVGVFAVACIAGRRSRSRVSAILRTFMASYAVVFVIAASFWDVNIVPDGRLFAPLLVAAIALVAIGLSRPFNHVRTQQAAFAAVSLWAIVMAAGSAIWLTHAHAEGLGYNSRAWQESDIIRAIRELPADTFVVSAANDAITAVTGRPAARLPDKLNPGTLAPNPAYATALASLADRLRRSNGVIVFFDRVRDRPYIPDESELARDWNLVLIVRARDGTIYRLRRSGE